MRKFLFIFTIFLSFLFSNPIEINKSSIRDILSSSEIFIDYTKNLTINEILNNQIHFSKITTSIKRFGYSPDFKVWVKFTLHNTEN